MTGWRKHGRIRPATGGAAAVAMCILCVLSGGRPTGGEDPMQEPGATPDPAPSRVAVPGVLYQRDFQQQQADDAWSHDRISETPNGRRRVFGPFEDETVELTFSDLPDHRFLVIRLDLFIIGPWRGAPENGALAPVEGDAEGADDGSSPQSPSRFLVEFGEGAAVMSATFDASPGRRQSWPEMDLHAGQPGGAGASGAGELGYSHEGPGEGDWRYHVRLAIPHEHPELTLRFAAEAGDVEPEEGRVRWALGGIRIDIEGEEGMHELEGERLERTWQTLAETNPAWVAAVQEEFIRGGSVAHEYLHRHASLAFDRLDELIAMLDEDDYARRQQAAAQLRNLGPAAAPRLRSALREGVSAEQRISLRRLLDQLEDGASRDARGRTLRIARAQHVLRLLEAGKRQEQE